MKKLRETLYLITNTEMSNRKIARQVGVSHTLVSDRKKLALKKKITAEYLNDVDDAKLEELMGTGSSNLPSKALPDFNYIHKELQYPHVTRQCLWEEYRLANPNNAYGSSQFNKLLKEYSSKLDLTMRQTHLAGEKIYVDFAGKGIYWVDRKTNKAMKAQIFIGVMGCSKFTFAYAIPSQSVPHWIEAHTKMLIFFGGVTEVIVPDNLKSAVIKSGAAFELNRTYLEFSKHNGTVIIPARVRKPQDKADAELGVKLFYRWVLVKLRHLKFFSIDEINKAILELLEEFNNRPFQKIPGTRRSRFEELDKPLLKPLPSEPFEFSEWTAEYKIGPDYHVRVKDHYYSVPHELVSSSVEARYTSKVVEFFHKGRRVASHARNNEVGGHTTNSNHQPKAHRAYANQKPELMMQWAKSVGESAEAVFGYQFEKAAHALLGVRSCSSLQRLAKQYGLERFEGACSRAIQIGSLTPKSIRSILQHGLENVEHDDRPIQVNLPLHNNVRGADYYSNGGH